MENTPVVRKTKSGNLVWRSSMDRKAAIRRYLSNHGYNVQVALNAFSNKFYIARTTSTGEKRVEQFFRTRAQAERLQYASRGRMYDTVEILNRDVLEILAADEILADA